MLLEFIAEGDRASLPAAGERRGNSSAIHFPTGKSYVYVPYTCVSAVPALGGFDFVAARAAVSHFVAGAAQ